MIEIYNTIQTFINSLIIIDFSSVETTLPTAVVEFYQTYVPSLVSYFIVGLVIYYLAKLLYLVFSLGGKNKWVVFGLVF